MKTENLFKLEIIAFFFFGLVLFTLGLGNQEFIGFETRFALFAKEMLQNGFSLFPTTYHQPYPDYPVSSTYLIFLLAKLTGHFNKLIAVLPSAFAAAVSLATTYAIGALQNRRWGLFAALMLLMTGTFFNEARTISLDQFTTAITSLCFYCVYSADILPKHSNVNEPLARPAHRLLFIPLLLILGFAFRGPIGLIIPSSVIGIYYLLDKNYKKLFLTGFCALVTLAACSLFLVFLAQKMSGTHFSNEVLSLEVFSRLQKSGHTPAFYYYFLHGLFAYAITLPLSILMIIGLRFAQPNLPTPDKNLITKLIGWALIILLGMSIPGDKKMRYILEIGPALALISAYLFIIPRDNKYFANFYKIFYQFCFYSPLIGLALSLGIYYFIHLNRLPLEINIGILIFVFSSLQLMNFLFSASFKNNKEFFIVLATTLSFTIFSILCIEPLNLSINRSRDFVLNLEILRYQQHAQLAFYQEDRDGLPIKYVVNSPQTDTPLFVSTPTELAQIKNKTFFIAGKEEFNQIPAAELAQYRIIASDVIGRKMVVVFTQKKYSPTNDLTALLIPLVK